MLLTDPMSPGVAVTVALPEATSWLISSGAVIDSDATASRLLVTAPAAESSAPPPMAASRMRCSSGSIRKRAPRLMAPSQRGPASYHASVAGVPPTYEREGHGQSAVWPAQATRPSKSACSSCHARRRGGAADLLLAAPAESAVAAI